MSTNPHHLSKSAEWGSPLDWIEVARTTLGTIDLDPASSDVWNRTVKATRFIDRRENGLVAAWAKPCAQVRVYLNPPGDSTGDLVRAFWERLVSSWRAGETSAAVWCGFSLEQLGYTQDAPLSPLDFVTHVPRSRKAYRKRHGGAVITADDPTHGSYLTLLPSRGATGVEQIRTFRMLLAPAGKVINARGR